MKILAIDTSALVATAALCEDETPIAVSSQKSGLTHSATMLPIVKNIMDNTNTSIVPNRNAMKLIARHIAKAFF